MNQFFQGQANNNAGGGFGFGGSQNTSQGFGAFQQQSQPKAIQPSIFNVSAVRPVFAQQVGSKPKQQQLPNQPKQSSSNIFGSFGGAPNQGFNNQKKFGVGNQQQPQQMQGGAKKLQSKKNSMQQPQTQQNSFMSGGMQNNNVQGGFKSQSQGGFNNMGGAPNTMSFGQASGFGGAANQSQNLFNQQQPPTNQGGFNMFNQAQTFNVNQSQSNQNKTLGSKQKFQQQKQPKFSQSNQQNDMQMESPFKGNQQMNSQSQNKFQQKSGNQTLGGKQQQASQLQISKKPHSVITKHLGNQNQTEMSDLTGSSNQNQKKFPQSQKKPIPAFIQGKSGSQQPYSHKLNKNDSQISLQPQESISSQSNQSKPQSLATSGKQSKGKYSNSQGVAAGGINITNQKYKENQKTSQNSSKQKKGESNEIKQDKGDEYYDEEYYDEEDYYGEEGEEEIDEGKMPLDSNNKKTQDQPGKKVCYMFQKGMCKFGAKCRDSHESAGGALKENTAKRPCKFFLSGNCTYGDKCKNSHEIGALDANNIAGLAKNLLAQGGLPKGFDVKKMQDLIKQTQDGGAGDAEYDDEDYYGEEEIEEKAVDKSPSKAANVDNSQMSKIAEQNKGKVISLQALKDQNAKLQQQNEEKKSYENEKPKDSIEQQKPAPAPKKSLAAKKPSLKSLQPLQKPNQDQAAPKEIVSTLKVQKQPQTQIDTSFVQPASISPSSIIKRRDQIINELKDIKNNAQQHIIKGKAELLGFCSDQEVYNRSEVDTQSASPFERDSQGQRFQDYAIKSYSRSAADKIMNEPSEIRPPIVLYKTIEYLRDCIADQDYLGKGNSTYKWTNPTFGDIYSFIRDRGRCISLDFIIIDRNSDEYYIKSLEELSRFLIMSYHDGFNCEVFDTFQNTQLLTKNLGSLKNCYEQVELEFGEKTKISKELTKNKIEFMSYLLIASGKDSVHTQAEIAKINIQSLSPEDSILLKQAIQINSVIQNGDAAKYFKLLDSKDINYLFKCMMINSLNDMRLTLIDQIVKGLNKGVVDTDFMQRVLKFIDLEDTAEFLEAAGFLKVGYENVFLAERKSIDSWKEKVNIWRQKNRLTFLDKIRGTQPRSSIMRNGIDNEEARQRVQQEKIKQAKENEIRQQIKLQDQMKQQEQQRLEKEKLEKENKLKMEKEMKLKAMQEKERLEKEAKDKKEREERERLQKELDEKKRQEKIAHEKKMKILKKFQTIAIKYRDNKENNKYTQMRKEFLEFGRTFKKLLGKRKDRDMIQEIETQMIEMFQQEAFIPIQNKEEVYKTLSSLELDYNQLETFKLKDWIGKVIPEREGYLQIKLLSSRIRPNKKPEQLWDILQMIILLFNNSLNKQLSNVMLKNAYNTDINSKLNMTFKYEEIEKLNDQQKDNLFLQTNLIMILTDQPSFEKDLAFIKEQLQFYPEYSKLNILVMIYGNDYSELMTLINKLNMSMVEDIRCERVLNVQIVPLCFHIQIKKKNITQYAYPQTLRALILAYLLQDLEKSLLKSKILNENQQNLKPILLQDVLERSLIDLTPVIDQVDADQQFQHETFYKKFFKDLSDSHNNSVYVQTFKNEIQILGFWLLTLNQILKPVIEALKDSVQIVVLSKKSNEEMIDLASTILDGLNILKGIDSIKNFQYPVQYNEKFNTNHVCYLITKELRKIGISPKIINKIESSINYIYRFKSVTPLHKNRRYYKGAKLFQSMFSHLFSQITLDHVSLIFPNSIMSLQDVDYIKIDNIMLAFFQHNKNTLEILEKQFPVDFEDKKEVEFIKQCRKVDVSYVKLPNTKLEKQLNKLEQKLKNSIFSEGELKKKSDNLAIERMMDEFNDQVDDMYETYKSTKRLRPVEMIDIQPRDAKRMKQDKFDLEQSAKFLEDSKKSLENLNSSLEFRTRSQLSGNKRQRVNLSGF